MRSLSGVMQNACCKPFFCFAMSCLGGSLLLALVIRSLINEGEGSGGGGSISSSSNSMKQENVRLLSLGMYVCLLGLVNYDKAYSRKIHLTFVLALILIGYAFSNFILEMKLTTTTNNKNKSNTKNNMDDSMKNYKNDDNNKNNKNKNITTNNTIMNITNNNYRDRNENNNNNNDEWKWEVHDNNNNNNNDGDDDDVQITNGNKKKKRYTTQQQQQQQQQNHDDDDDTESWESIASKVYNVFTSIFLLIFLYNFYLHTQCLNDYYHTIQTWFEILWVLSLVFMLCVYALDNNNNNACKKPLNL